MKYQRMASKDCGLEVVAESEKRMIKEPTTHKPHLEGAQLFIIDHCEMVIASTHRTMEADMNVTHDEAKRSTPTRLLLDRVAVITGGARGIGAATVKLFAEHGANVVIADILDELGLALADSIGGRYVHCDVAKEEDVELAVETALAWKGRLDIMFNNAGVPGEDGSITRLDMEQVKHIISVNVHGVIHGIKYAAKAMIQKKLPSASTGGGGSGCIISSSSSAALMGGLGSHAYTLSKEAIVGLTRTAACELGVHGIRVNCISPHGVPSEMLVSAYRKFLGRNDVTAEDVGRTVGQRGSLLRGRAPTVDDVAHAVLFLAAEEQSRFITGHNLVVDGGYTSACSYMSFIYN